LRHVICDDQGMKNPLSPDTILEITTKNETTLLYHISLEISML